MLFAYPQHNLCTFAVKSRLHLLQKAGDAKEQVINAAPPLHCLHQGIHSHFSHSWKHCPCLDKSLFVPCTETLNFHTQKNEIVLQQVGDLGSVNKVAVSVCTRFSEFASSLECVVSSSYLEFCCIWRSTGIGYSQSPPLRVGELILDQSVLPSAGGEECLAIHLQAVGRCANISSTTAKGLLRRSQRRSSASITPTIRHTSVQNWHEKPNTSHTSCIRLGSLFEPEELTSQRSCSVLLFLSARREDGIRMESSSCLYVPSSKCVLHYSTTGVALLMSLVGGSKAFWAC